jgi:hypothetical protein
MLIIQSFEKKEANSRSHAAEMISRHTFQIINDGLWLPPKEIDWKQLFYCFRLIFVRGEAHILSKTHGFWQKTTKKGRPARLRRRPWSLGMSDL